MYGYYYKAGKSWEDVKLWEATKDNPQEDINVESFLKQENYWNIGNVTSVEHIVSKWHNRDCLERSTHDLIINVKD